jgi:excisionase family DNA binding protein
LPGKWYLTYKTFCKTSPWIKNRVATPKATNFTGAMRLNLMPRKKRGQLFMEPFGFDQLPEAVRKLIEKVDRLETLIVNLQPKNEDQDKMINIQEAAAFLNMSVAALYSLVSRKDIPVNKPGKRLYFNKNELNEWIRSGRKKTAATIEQEATLRKPVYQRRFKR